MQTYAQAMPHRLPTTAPQQSGNTITLQQALARGTSPDVLCAVASWNEYKSYDERRRKARHRHKAQCVALRNVAAQLERGQMREAA